MLFLAQINCADLGPRAESFKLPASGVLSFFGDHDDVNGCGGYNGGAVYYFQDPQILALAPPPLDDFEPLITCDMDFYETLELPHPFSEAVQALDFDDDEKDAYHDLYAAFAHFGFDENLPLNDMDISKLFGWPDLVQHEIEDAYSERTRLLLQLGEYHDGTELCGWGPGGLLYFMMRPRDLTSWSFGQAELTVQCT
jgi:uncharacterized protein YwqG